MNLYCYLRRTYIYMAMLTSVQQTQLSNLFSKVIENDEFEIMFNNYKTDNKLSIIKFMNVLKYLKYRSDNEKNNLVHEVVLDITFGYDSMVSYRVSITGIKEINDFFVSVHPDVDMNKFIKLSKLTSIPFYFIFMNVSQIIGAYRYIMGNQKVTWEKSKRRLMLS